MPARSYLYVPGDRAEMVAKAQQFAADAVIVDLEDAVTRDQKDAAREIVMRAAASWPARAPELWVRVDPAALADDVGAAVGPALRGIVVAKALPEVLADADALLSASKVQEGSSGPIGLMPLVESGAGLRQVDAMAAARRVRRLAIGEVDLCGELGIEPSPDEGELTPLRLQLVVASAVAGIGRPVGPVSVDVRDLAGLQIRAQALSRLGFRAMQAIHPAQLDVINQVFAPSEQEIERAHAVLTRYRESVASGRGAVLDDDGAMIDRAVVRRAHETLERAGLAASDD